MTNPYKLIYSLTKVVAVVAYVAFGLFLFSQIDPAETVFVAGATFAAWAFAGFALSMILDFWRKFLIQVSITYD